MKKLLALTVLLAAFIGGCGLADMNYSQRSGRYRNAVQINSRQIVDDFDYFWLAERPSHLTYWYVRSPE